MKQKVRSATKQWFEERNRAWLSGDYERLHTKTGRQPAVAEMVKRKTMHGKRGAVDRKIISDVQINEAAPLPVPGAPLHMRIRATEHIRFLYEISGVIEHEQRLLIHEFWWDLSTGVPVLAKHLQGAEEQPQAEGDAEDESTTNDLNPALFRSGYDRTLAFRYAERWWNDLNPQYADMGVDCTNYVSQVLRAGGFPFYRLGNRSAGWWYQFGAKPKWSYSWAVANALGALLSNPRNPFRAKIVHKPEDLTIGDVIAYDWKGSGNYGHNTVVTGQDANGYPLVNAHTVNSHMRFYSYEDSYAWTPSTRYLFVHFLD